MYSVEVERRLAKAQRYLESAEADFAAGRYDIAATGCYFCAFHAVVAYLVDDGYTLAKGARWSHGYVQREFGSCVGVTGDRLLRKMLLKLYQSRVVAEYQTVEVERADASHLIAFAHRIHEFVTGVVAGVTQGAAGATENE